MSLDELTTTEIDQPRHMSWADHIVDQAHRILALLWAWMSGALVGKSALVLLDQAVVSGTRFVTTVIVGRLCGQDELGIYSLAFASVLLIASVQESLITTPYMVFGIRLRNRARSRYAGSVLTYQRVLTGLAILGLALAALILQSGLGPKNLAPAMWILVAVVPFSLLWEFGRRYSFAHLNVGVALAMDVGVATIQLGGLLLLALSGQLSAVTAYAVMGTACGVVGITWLVCKQSSFDVRFPRAVRQWRRNWSFGKWVFASQLVGVVHGFAAFWILAIVMDASAAGLFAACQSIALLSNPIILAMCNLLGPQAAQAHAQGGIRLVKRTVGKMTLLVSIALVFFAGGLWFAGDQILTLLYGSEYAGNGTVVAVLGLCTIAWAVSAAVSNGLWAIKRPDLYFKTSTVGLTITVIGSSVLIASGGILGATLGLLLGSIVAAAAQCWALFLYQEKTNNPLPAAS